MPKKEYNVVNCRNCGTKYNRADVDWFDQLCPTCYEHGTDQDHPTQ